MTVAPCRIVNLPELGPAVVLAVDDDGDTVRLGILSSLPHQVLRFAADVEALLNTPKTAEPAEVPTALALARAELSASPTPPAEPADTPPLLLEQRSPPAPHAWTAGT